MQNEKKKNKMNENIYLPVAFGFSMLHAFKVENPNGQCTTSMNVIYENMYRMCVLRIHSKMQYHIATNKN